MAFACCCKRAVFGILSRQSISSYRLQSIHRLAINRRIHLPSTAKILEPLSPTEINQIGIKYTRTLWKYSTTAWHSFSRCNIALSRAYASRKGEEQNLEGIQKHVSPLSTRRAARKKSSRDGGAVKREYMVSAYSIAEECDLEGLMKEIETQGLYALCPLPDTKDVLHLNAIYKVDDETREIFIFREGSAVFWNVPYDEEMEVLKFLHKYLEDPYSLKLVNGEAEELTFKYTDTPTKLDGDEIHIHISGSKSEENSQAIQHQKYAFSNALSLSVKLGIWEASLEKYVASIEWVTEDLKNGKSIRMTKPQVLIKTGELFTLRHLINLSSDLLDTPDFYWDREDLESLYQSTCSQLNINRRTMVMNEKLNYCVELTQLVSDHLNQDHQSRLEWIIIILILVEVIFECIHYAENYHEKQEAKRRERELFASTESSRSQS
ncbi:required for meiotic nuclear division protein 1 homolog [Tubulanus polymorphus]|uniref:required for meiotic nuclear division protein 1 homolog n=1 Tax=Tubulanus polymorphus TaxID=672921 RepID=UPI003DA56CBB